MTSKTISAIQANRKLLGAPILYVGERLVTSFVSFVVFMALIRYYSPKDLGIWSFSTTIIQLAAPFLASGAEAIVMRELIKGSSPRRDILGSAAFVIATTTLAALLIPLSYLALFHSKDSGVMAIALLASIGFLPNFILVVEQAFRADSNPIPPTFARLVTTLVSALAKVLIARAGYPITFIALVLPVETLIQIGLLIVFAKKIDACYLQWSISGKTVLMLYKSCLPAMLAGVVITLYFRINYILLEHLADFREVGLYAFAFNIVQLLAIIPTVALVGVYPSLVRLASTNPLRFNEVMGILFWLGGIYAASIAFCGWLTGGYLIPLIFGEKYSAAQPCLVLMLISLVALTSGSIRAVIINIGNHQGCHLWSAAIGLVTLVPISAILIPHFGSSGAALGVLVGSIVSAVLMTFAFPSIRAHGRRQLLGMLLIPPFRQQSKV